MQSNYVIKIFKFNKAWYRSIKNTLYILLEIEGKWLEVVNTYHNIHNSKYYQLLKIIATCTHTVICSDDKKWKLACRYHRAIINSFDISS